MYVLRAVGGDVLDHAAEAAVLYVRPIFQSGASWYSPPRREFVEVLGL